MKMKDPLKPLSQPQKTICRYLLWTPPSVSVSGHAISGSGPGSGHGGPINVCDVCQVYNEKDGLRIYDEVNGKEKVNETVLVNNCDFENLNSIRC